MAEFQSLTTLIKRLEAATSRLEDLATSSGSNVSVNNFTSPSSNVVASKSELLPVLEAYDELIEGSLKNFLELSKTIGGLVLDQSHSVEDAFVAQRDFIYISTQSKKPEVSKTIELIGPTQQALKKVYAYTENNRPSPFFNHLSTVSEGIGALGWVAIEQKPAPHVGDLKESSQFYANRVITEFKDKYEIIKLQNYVKKFHTTGLAWNPKGADPETFIGRKSTELKSASLPSSTGITSTLKKVDKSQMTHKNPGLRAGGTVSDVGATKLQKRGPTAPPKPASLSLKKPPRKILEGIKWTIENFENDSIVVEETAINHAIYIYGCKNSTIQVKGKINTITLVSTVDVVNCKSFQLQIQGKTPTIVIDKTDSGQIYLSEECLEVEILTSKSSSINVNLPGLGEDGDYAERPIPEQIKSTIVDGKINSVPMEFSE
ncbi:1768_t:CDS:2 [Acaulospora colombiana]|uniref:1768_t:CDS:1 n=1 Tax=Acaulospora colombiana TaxID=27376 RepID=A0ACA9LZ39_9GLOM|nr:1768_t:CDS:2 [Acaulospora colombiana]